MFDKVLLSRNGFNNLQKEIEKITEEITTTHIEMGESVKRDNDLRENPEYMELRVKAMYTLPQKKQELLEKLNNCIIIENTEEYVNFDGKVIPGSRVTFSLNNKNKTMTILGDGEGDFSNDIISYVAPIAKVMLGKYAQDEVEFNNSKIKILSVERI